MIEGQREKLIIPMALVVAIAWLASLGYAMLSGQFVPLSVVTPVMLILAGYVFGASIVRRGTSNGN